MLIVEDNAMNAQLARVVLEHGGFDVVEVADARSALAMLSKVTPQVVVLDLGLPDMDGLALVKRLRAEAATHDLVIVAMTAAAMQGDEERALAAGCDGYLTKPINVRTVADSVAAFVQAHARACSSEPTKK